MSAQQRKGNTGFSSEDKNIEEAKLVAEGGSDVEAELIDIEKAEAAKKMAKED